MNRLLNRMTTWPFLDRESSRVELEQLGMTTSLGKPTNLPLYTALTSLAQCARSGYELRS